MRRDPRRIALVWSLFVACALAGYLGVRAFAQSEPGSNPPSESSLAGSPAPPPAAPPAGEESGLAHRAMSAAGLCVLIGLCALMSNNRARINWRLVAWGVGLQFIFGAGILKTRPGLWLFSRLNDGILALLGFTQVGSSFLFRSFVSGRIDHALVNFTFSVLPTIIFFSSLMTVGYYLGVMQLVVKAFAVVMQKTMRCSGAETLSTAANIFVGQTEAPLVVKPYVKDMTQSELLTIMVGGFANTAGGVLAAYVSMLHPYFPEVAGHLIAQSVMSAPAALACSKIVWPETQRTLTGENLKMVDEKVDANVIDAAARGAGEGLQLALNVAAMLLAFIALVALANAMLQNLCALAHLPKVTLEGILAVPGAAVAFIIGVPWADCWAVGKLIGVKTTINEFVAYMQMAEMLKSGAPMSHRAVVIASYALCSFGNFSSIAVQIGGIGAIAPNRRHDLARLGLLAMVTGSIAAFMTAAIAGILVP